MRPEQIKSLRLRLGLTQAEAAALCGVAPNTWARWERSEIVPKAPALKLLSILPQLAKSLQTASREEGGERGEPGEGSESNAAPHFQRPALTELAAARLVRRGNSMPSTHNIHLRGITWNHSRGFLPMVATAQRFAETHPGIEIAWEKRSLQEFADYPVEKLAETFDLLVIDHPFVGYAARHRILAPLDDNLDADFLDDQSQNSVGRSHESYFYGGHQWALAIDAATPVSSWRPDLLAQASASPPETWKELLALARRGLVAFPSIPVDSLMNFYMCCCALGEGPFKADGALIDTEAGSEALAMLRELVSLSPPEILSWNPIATYEAMARRDEIAYCPFAYGYSNYSRQGYAQNVLQFGDLCRIRGSERARTTLGGTGLAISAACRNPEIALEYARYAASPGCQKTLYVQSGGQPGHRSAWTDTEVNRSTGDFFQNTLPALDRAYLRPRYAGYIYFQDHAALAVHKFLREGGDPRPVMRELQSLYERSKESEAGA